jgi:hypothetical protein
MNKLESINSDLFAPMSATEAAMVKGGMESTQPTSTTIYSNCWVPDAYTPALDKDVIPDGPPPEPTPSA